MGTPEAAQQAPGAEFLLRRLARATAIPAAERTPDVAAFVESVQLLREACDLLPLTRHGRAALSLHIPADRQQVLLAFLKVARARYLSPEPPVCDRPHGAHLQTYCMVWHGLSHPCRHSSDMAALENLMLLSATSWQVTAADAAELASNTAAMLADEGLRQAVSRGLQQLAAATGQEQPLRLGQLRYLCCCDAAQTASKLQLHLDFRTAAAHGGVAVPADLAVEVLPPAQLAAVRLAGHTCAAQLMELEPHNPKSYLIAAWAAQQAGQPDRATQLDLQALNLARQQRDDWTLVESVQCAVMWAGQAAKTAPGSIRRSNMEAAAAAATHPEVEQALGRCRRLLPRPWVDELASNNWSEYLQVLQARLSGQTQEERAVTAAEWQQQVDDLVRLSECTGCKD